MLMVAGSGGEEGRGGSVRSGVWSSVAIMSLFCGDDISGASGSFRGHDSG